MPPTTSVSRSTRSLAKFGAKWDLNLHNPVSQLSADVLLVIFGFVRNSTTEKLLRREYGLQGLINITHVCHRWRSAALASSSLWSSIELVDDKCRWAMEMLKRSKGSLLRILLDYKVMENRSRQKQTPISVARSAFSQVQKHIERCQELVIVHTSINRRLFSFGTDFNGYSLSNLDSLTLELDEYAYPVVRLSDMEIKASSLRKLRLSNVNLHWNASFMRGLTHLKLHKQRETTTIVQLLDHLCNIPSLVDLDIELHTRMILHDQMVVQNQTKQLSLTHLSVTSPSPQLVVSLLSIVAIHPLRLNIILNMIPAEAEHLPNLYDIVNRHIFSSTRSHAPIPDRSYTFLQSHPWTLHVVGDSICNGETTSTGVSNTNTLHLDVMCFLSYEHETPPFLVPACQHLSVEGLEALKFRAAEQFSAENWCAIYGRVPTLRSIYVKGPNIFTFFEALVDGTFPALDTISCETVMDVVANQKLEQQIPYQYLQLRKDRGTPLKDFFFIGIPGLSEKCESRLRSVVGRLEFTYID